MKPLVLCRYKTVVLAFLCCCISITAIAQAPANDNCAGAVVLTSATSCNPVTGTFKNATTSSTAAPVFSYTAATTFATLGGIAGIKVECWGAGGGGGGNTSSTTRGGGAGAGGYSSGIVSAVSVGGTYTINVGTGGTGGTANGVAPSGGVSSFVAPSGTVYVSANGGVGGTGAASSGAAGAGGGATTNTGTTTNVNRVGGNGAAGTAANSGGGGGGAGSTAAGVNASGITAGTATTISGGAGGAGQTGNAAGGNGANYGGGGGGGRGTNAGGNGAGGLVKVTMGTSATLDVWYRFVAASANPSIQLSNVGVDLVSKSPYIQLYSSCGGTLIQTETDGIMGTSGLSIGTTYYIRIATIVDFTTASTATGDYTFDICVRDDLPSTSAVDFSKAYINISKGSVGGTVNPGDTLEIRATFNVKSGTITNISFKDTLKANAGFTYIAGTLATRTNEGKVHRAFTDVNSSADAGWMAQVPVLLDTTININMGTNATNTVGGTLTPSSNPSFYNFTCIILATYRVKVTAGYNTKMNFGGGAITYTISGTNYVINFPKDSLMVYPNLSACSDGVAPANLIGSANNGNFGTLITGASASGTQNAALTGLNTTYSYNTFNPNGPQDYYYGIVNNTSATNKIDNTVLKGGEPYNTRVFNNWDITGDHTGASNTARGNKPCDETQPVSATNPCGYMFVVNSSYRTDKVFEYTAGGVCTDTYYEVSAWFKNVCYRCGCDSLGRAPTTAGYIPTAFEDSSGVRPNIAMQIDGVDYYTTGDLVYQGLRNGSGSRTQTGSDTLNDWVRRSFVFKTSSTQSSFKITFRNNAPGGGGNDWAIDDIGLRTCYPTMTYAPPNPIVYMGSPLTITDTVRSYYNSYTYYKWQRKPVSGSWADVIPASSGNATPVFNPSYGQYEFVVSYTIPGTATLAANAGDEYRLIVASNILNLVNGCNFVPSTTFKLLPTDAPCALSSVNTAIAPQTGNINWNKLDWSLGHVPTCCESAVITYNSANASKDSITVDITNDICIINLTLLNTSGTTNQYFKTILHPGYSMQMNGNVRMGATSAQSTDSCVFIARGGGTITVNGNTVIGYPTDNAYCVFGSSPDIASAHNYVFKGDSLTFNARSFTNDKLITATMNPLSGRAYLVNNTNVSPFPNAVTFESLKIGDGVTASTVVTSGTNPNSFMNNRGGTLDVTANSTLILPANYTINARTPYNSSVQLRSNSNLKIGGYNGGTAGSNFPANFTSYTAHAQSNVEYYGNSSGTQTVYALPTGYGKLELRNDSLANGSGRAQKNSTGAFSSATSINVNQQTDFTLGTLGSSTQTIASAGPFTVAAGSGLYCNANVISGAGAFTLGAGGYLGMGHAQGITSGAFATGNMQMTGGRIFPTTGNYIYNGLVTQITGNGLPTTCNDLYIDNPTTVTIATSQTVTGLHYLKQGVFDIGLNNKITISGATGVLNSITGKMKANQGLLDMKGTAGVQTISGNWFVNRNISTLINSNTTGLTLTATAGDSLLVSSALLYGTGTINSAITTNNNLTLLSRDSATARFGEIVTGSGNTITGNVNVERYIRSLRKWRHLAWNTTSSQTAMQSWMENNLTANGNIKPGYGTIVTDEKATWSANGFDSRSVSGPSVKYYDPVNNNYIGIPNTGSYAMNSQSAYYNFVRGDRSCTPANALVASTILRSTGTLKTGNQVFTIPANQFGAIGNPYASAIDLRKLDTLNLTSTFYVWDPNLTGLYGLGGYQTIYLAGANYQIIPGGGSYGSVGSVVDTLESGQALYVKARSSAGTLTFKESAKTIGKRTMARQGDLTPVIFALLSLTDPGSTTLVDGAMGVFDNDYSNEVDYDDALKMPNTSENISLKRENKLLAIERRRLINETDTLFMNMTGMRIHQYQWDISSNNLSSINCTAYLIDKFLDSRTELNTNQTNTIVFDITGNAASYAADRFMIVFKQQEVLPVRFTNISAVRNTDKTVTVKYTTQTEINMHDYKVQSGTDGVHFNTIGTQSPSANNGGGAAYSFFDTHASSGTVYYRVQGNSVNGQVQYTAIAKVGPVTASSDISIFPNPVTDGRLNIRFVNQPNGIYSVKVTNKIGQLIYTGSIKIENSNTVSMIRLDPNIARGNYQATVTDDEGKSTTMSFIIK